MQIARVWKQTSGNLLSNCTVWDVSRNGRTHSDIGEASDSQVTRVTRSDTGFEKSPIGEPLLGVYRKRRHHASLASLSAILGSDSVQGVTVACIRRSV